MSEVVGIDADPAGVPLPDPVAAGEEARPGSTGHGPAVRVPVKSLLPGRSVRLEGEDADHTQALAKIETRLPPILVRRRTMRVIDGMHRLHAAQLRGDDMIDVQFFDGGEEDAFLLAVERNLAHGLPLSLSDRKAAACRLIAAHPEWSDRAIAVGTGLSGKTVGTIRERSDEELPQPNTRLGRDGRAYPVDGRDGRLRAREIVAGHPDASVREIAKTAGVSLGTAHDVRKQMRLGQDPTTPGGGGDNKRTGPPRPGGPLPATGARSGSSAAKPCPADEARWAVLRRQLSRDPAIRYSDAGRRLLGALDACAIRLKDCNDLVNAVPPHWSGAFAELARYNARKWLVFAERLEKEESEPASGR